jgi:hypothetical protein
VNVFKIQEFNKVVLVQEYYVSVEDCLVFALFDFIYLFVDMLSVVF